MKNIKFLLIAVFVLACMVGLETLAKEIVVANENISIKSPEEGNYLKGKIEFIADISAVKIEVADDIISTDKNLTLVWSVSNKEKSEKIGESVCKVQSNTCSFVWNISADSIKDGSYKIWVVTTDGLNKSKEVSFNVDNTAPTITAPADIAKEAEGDKTIVDLGTPIVSDNSGIKPTVKNDANCFVGDVFIPCGFNVGENKIIWTATDEAGNIAKAIQKVTIFTKEIIVANENISIKSPEEGNYLKGKIEFLADISGIGTQVDDIVSTDKDITVVWNVSHKENSLKIGESICKVQGKICSFMWNTNIDSIKDGSYKIWVVTTDGLNKSKEISFSVDNTAPVITVAPYVETTTDQDITVTATTNEGSLNFTSKIFTENGSFTFTATDLAGNTSSKIVTITNIDKTVTVTPPPVTSRGGGGGGYLRPKVTVVTPVVATPTVGQVLGASDFKFTTFLKKGMTLSDVKELQDRLRTEGSFTLAKSTNYFGTLTLKGVKAYQKNHGIPSTGFVGPLTIAELNK